MQTIEYKDVVDKSKWDRGEWDNEPDKKQWLDEATGLPCLIVRGPHGALCGYVGVPKSHILHGINYSEHKGGLEKLWAEVRKNSVGKRGVFTLLCADDDKPTPEMLFNVHGSLTFSDFCQPVPPGEEGHGICHVVEGEEGHGICHVVEGEEEPVWWFGFDCSHSGDFSPGMTGTYREIEREFPEFLRDRTYRNMAYVTTEVQSLAKQLKGITA